MFSQDNAVEWQNYRSINAAIRMSPTTSGVYAIGQRTARQGLPVSFQWAYVGRSDRLRARLKRHQRHSEDNPGLRAWLHKYVENVEVWVALTNSAHSRLLEVRLVQELQPSHNRIKFIGEQDNARR